VDHGGWAEEDGHRMMNALPSILHILAEGNHVEPYWRTKEGSILSISGDYTPNQPRYQHSILERNMESEARGAKTSIRRRVRDGGYTFYNTLQSIILWTLDIWLWSSGLGANPNPGYGCGYDDTFEKKILKAFHRR
jgi:hypothetical protein